MFVSMFKYLKRADISVIKKKTEIPRCIANRFYKGEKKSVKHRLLQYGNINSRSGAFY